jgi:hypothetical protein
MDRRGKHERHKRKIDDRTDIAESFTSHSSNELDVLDDE